MIAGVILLAALAALALSLGASQARARRALDERFAAQAQARAALTSAVFNSSIAAAGRPSATLYGTRVVSAGSLTAAVRSAHIADLVLVARSGRVLAASAGTPAAVLSVARARPAYVREAFAGAPFSLSGVISLGGKRAVVQLAEGIDTAFGRRVALADFSPKLLSAFFGRYLLGGSEPRDERAYVLDERGVIVAGAPLGSAGRAPAVGVGLLGALRRRARGSFGAHGYFVASPIPNTRWRVVLTEPEASLYASLSGVTQWAPWAVFVALALMSCAALVLGGRSVRSAARARHNDARLRAAIDARLQLAGIVESSDDAIIGQTLRGRIVSWNRGAEKLLGYSASEIVGSPVAALLPADRKDELAATMERINADEVDHRETVRLARGGRPVDVALTISPVRNASGELTGVATIARDITERRRIEAALVLARDQALEASRSKSEFVANMSHEIRTPLNGVIGMTELLRETPLNAVQSEYLDALGASSEALLAVINDILDFSKMEAGRFELDPVDFELRDAVEEACLMLAPEAHAKGLEISHSVDAEVPAAVNGDRARLRQVLLNLLANAVKFTDHGEVILRVSPEPAQHVRFAVLDTGVGIDDTRATSLFDAFVQADLSSSRRHGGTGLGLTISRQLVERMGGEIGARAREEGGSEFWFTAELAPAKTLIAAAHARPELSGRRVLVVERSASGRAILERYLTDWGLVSESAELPRAALAKLEQAAASGRPFELVVLDYATSEIDGLELARAIRERTSLASVGIVLLSSAPLDRDALGPAGVSRLLSKPARQAELIQALADSVARADGEAPPTDGDARATVGAESTPSGEARPDPSGPVVLVAEDNEINRAVATALLARRNLRTEIAVNGEEAVRMAGEREFAAIFMDCQMPELDGYEAARRIRESERDAHVPIIAMTAHSMAGDRERCIAAGMDDYLSKPVRAKELDAAIERWLPTHFWAERADRRAAAASRDAARGGAGSRADGASAATEGPPAPLIDSVTVRQLREALTGAMRADLIAKFEENLPRIVSEIEQAFRDGDSGSMRRAAHTLKGSSATLGAERLRRICTCFERTRASDPPIAEAQVEELRSVASRTSEALRAELLDARATPRAGTAHRPAATRRAPRTSLGAR